MRWLLCLGTVLVLMHEITCPPVQPEIKPVEGDSPDDGDDEGFGLEYDRYLREIVMALEEDESFRKKLEEMNMTDIKNGKIASHLDLVSHQIRERLDEIKRQEMNRLRMLAKEKMKQMNGIQRMDETYLHHVDVKNPHSFESQDLEKLIKKATNDLDELDKKRKGEFKQYEMEKEHQRREELKNLDEEKRKAREEEYDRMKQRHREHPKVHHPGSKDQLEDVWEKTDHMEGNEFSPKTFFKMHDLDGNEFLDQEEVEALFQKELDQVYDPNMPEDDMRERYEDMARMREHVFEELDKDKDRLISMEEFLTYTASQEFEKDDGWKTVDEEQNFTDEEYERYEQMLREHEERMRAQGLDPNMAQPGMVPVGHDPNVQEMQIPQGQGRPQGQGMPQHGMPQQGMQQQGMNQQQQQQFHQQQQLNQHEQMRQMGQMQGQGQMGQGHQQQMGQGQMQGHQQQMSQGQMPGHQQQMGQGQMPGQGQMNMGQGQMHGGQPNMGGGPMMDGMPQMQMQGGPPGHMPQGQMPPEHVAMGQGGIPRPPHPDDVPMNHGNQGNRQPLQRSPGQGQDSLKFEGQGHEQKKPLV
ncbi:hypothetical protein ACF0H5_016326 [Mactra antiquata]